MGWPWTAHSLNTDRVKHDGVVFAGYLHGDSRLVVPDGADVLPPARKLASQPDLPCLRYEKKLFLRILLKKRSKVGLTGEA